jgi:hypothetical protein
MDLTPSVDRTSQGIRLLRNHRSVRRGRLHPNADTLAPPQARDLASAFGQKQRRGSSVRSRVSRRSLLFFIRRARHDRLGDGARFARRLGCVSRRPRGRQADAGAKAKVRCRSRSAPVCIGTTVSVDRSEHRPSASRSPSPSVRGPGAARLLRLSRLLGPRYRKATAAKTAAGDSSGPMR